MDHQDWKTVILRNPNNKPKPPPPVKVPVGKVNPNAGNLAGTGKKVIEDGDVHKVDKVGSTIGKQISQARVAKKMSQKDLATKMQLQLQVIQQYENGKAVRNNSMLSKFEKALGTKFKR